jgi:mRNA interferase RelE/StbE
MAEFEINFKESVWKHVNKIPKKDLRNILRRIKALSKDPRPPGCEKLTGQEQYRLRQGRYRIVYSIQENELTVWIVKVGHRKDVYRYSEHAVSRGFGPLFGLHP